MDRAVIFVPSLDPAHVRWVLVCGEFCSRRGYLITAVVGSWADTIAMVMERAADIVVTARRDHLPPDRLPRLDVVAEACLEVHALQADPPARPSRTGDASRTWEARR